MTQEEQLEAFEKDLQALTMRYSQEFELTLTGMIGCLELEKLKLVDWALNDNDNDED